MPTQKTFSMNSKGGVSSKGRAVVPYMRGNLARIRLLEVEDSRT